MSRRLWLFALVYGAVVLAAAVSVSACASASADEQVARPAAFAARLGDLKPVRDASSSVVVNGEVLKTSKATVTLRGRESDGDVAGTAVVFGASGDALTNAHVVRGVSDIVAHSAATGRSYPVVVLNIDARRDLALIQLAGARDLPTASFGDSSSVRIGQQVSVIGNAGGLGLVVANGKVTGLDQDVESHDDDDGDVERLHGMIQVDAAVVPGDSGGPLVDSATGLVLGIDTATRDPDSGRRRAGFAIPIHQADTWARRWLVKSRPLDEDRSWDPDPASVWMSQPRPSTRAPSSGRVDDAPDPGYLIVSDSSVRLVGPGGVVVRSAGPDPALSWAAAPGEGKDGQDPEERCAGEGGRNGWLGGGEGGKGGDCGVRAGGQGGIG